MGRNVTRFRAGDAVFGACRGAFAEFACASESRLARKPDRITFDQAASVAVAGGVGTFAVQIARHFGANVTGVCSSRNLELVRSLGAHQVIDYGREDFTRMGAGYDLILDAVGNRSAAACGRALTPRGICVFVGAPKGFWPMPWFLMVSILGGMLRSHVSGQTTLSFMARVDSVDLAALAELMNTGKIAPVIDRRYRLTEARDAMRYAEEGHARGKIVLTVQA